MLRVVKNVTWRHRIANKALCLVSVAVCVRSAAVHLYVSPTGSDSNNGRQSSHPVKTLSHVVDMLDDSGIQGNTVFVELMEGYHDLSSNLHLVSTSGEVIFRAYQGQEVHVTGGKRLPSDQFRHVSDSHVQQRLPQSALSKVLELDLAAVGISDLGTLQPYGFGQSNWNAPMEIFINGKPLRLAEWPNSNFINIKSVPDGQNGRNFTYDSDNRDRLWAQETEPWAYGWWYWGWADLSVPVSHIDPSTHTITLGRDTHYGLRVGHYDPSHQNGGNNFGAQGGYFRVINMLCELDQPGEYYIDRTSRKLYVWPNTPQQTITSSDVVYASMIDDCITIESGARRLHFQDFTVEACRHRGLELRTAQNITVSNMEIKNTGGSAVHCSGNCQGVSVLASEIHDVGGGVRLSGGDRTHLVSSRNVIRDNHIWDHARNGAQPNDAVNIGGVGIVVSHNHLHHGQYTGIRWSGNDHIMEYNHIHHMCWNSSDCGAIHSGRDWTWRGNVIRYNHIHHTLRRFPGASVRGIMLDDEYSSVLIEKNVFYENEVHANIGGGRDNVIRYNIMYDATAYSIQVDGRGLGSSSHADYLRGKLQRTAYRSDLWRQRYPDLYDILNRHPEAPEGNEIYDNVFYNQPGIERIHYSGGSLTRTDYFDVHNNLRVFSTSAFWSPGDADFRLRCEAAQWASSQHFADPVSVEEVGPTVATGPSYLRAHRQSPAARTTSVPASCDSGATVAPAAQLRGSYLPDGSSPNTLYPDIPDTGCWFVIDHCPNHPEAEGTHKDDTGTRAGTEEGCLARAGPQWQWCGSPDNGRVVSVYGPTGAMTIGAYGCYFADYGCHSASSGSIHRDSWAEQHENAANDEAACLRRASPQWIYCGSPQDRPITSIYGPTGAFRTAGAGCWIKVQSCPADHSVEGYFFDAWGDTNRYTGTDSEECFDRANAYWIQCGSHDNAPVIAYYRPAGSSRTVP